MMGMMGGGGGGSGGGGGGGLGGLAGAIAAAQAARNAGNQVHQALGMSNSAYNGAGSNKPGGGANPGQFVPKMSGREMLGHANKARIAGNQIHSALGMARPPAPGTPSTPGHAPPPPPPPPPPGGYAPGDFEGEVIGGGRGMGGIDFAELRRGVGGMMGVGKSMGAPVVRGYGEKAGCECALPPSRSSARMK